MWLPRTSEVRAARATAGYTGRTVALVFLRMQAPGFASARLWKNRAADSFDGDSLN
jgi:hypothetical protein